jgi:hypothetical protein
MYSVAAHQNPLYDLTILTDLTTTAKDELQHEPAHPITFRPSFTHPLGTPTRRPPLLSYRPQLPDILPIHHFHLYQGLDFIQSLDVDAVRQGSERRPLCGILRDSVHGAERMSDTVGFQPVYTPVGQRG